VFVASCNDFDDKCAYRCWVITGDECGKTRCTDPECMQPGGGEGEEEGAVLRMWMDKWMGSF
jgi:hypothetical protein